MPVNNQEKIPFIEEYTKVGILRKHPILYVNCVLFCVLCVLYLDLATILIKTSKTIGMWYDSLVFYRRVWALQNVWKDSSSHLCRVKNNIMYLHCLNNKNCILHRSERTVSATTNRWQRSCWSFLPLFLDIITFAR